MGKPVLRVSQPSDAQPVDCDRYSIKNVQISGSKSSLSWLALLLILNNCTMKDQNFFHVHLVLFETDDQYFPTPPLDIQVHIDTPGHKNLPGRTQNHYFHSKDIVYFSH